MGKNVRTDILIVFLFVLKSGWVFACDSTVLRKKVFYNFLGWFASISLN